MKLLNMTEAAEYCGFADDRDYFRGLVTNGKGPDYLMPSPRRVYFTHELLDRWILSWERKGCYAGGAFDAENRDFSKAEPKLDSQRGLTKPFLKG